MPPGQESLVIIVDYKSTTLRTNPSISVARKVLHILQQHYVETLGRAIVVNLPMLLSFFYKGISPFLDPVTRDKVGLVNYTDKIISNGQKNHAYQMRFNPDLFELIPKSQLDADFGGEHTYEFDAQSYWDQIVAYVNNAYSSRKRRSFDVTNFFFFSFLVFSACGVKEDGTRVDFPPESEKVDESPDDGSPTLSSPSSTVTAISSPRANEKTGVDVDVSAASVEADEHNAVHEIMS